MTKIINKDSLIANGETSLTQKARSIALQTLEHTLNQVNAASLLKAKVKLKDHQLNADTCSFDLNRFRDVYVVGGGKAAGPMAQAMENLLGRRITEGYVNVPQGDESRLSIIELHGASHPIPDEAGVKGTKRMLQIAEKANEDDLVIVLISGGGSSLMPLPREGVSLKDKREVTNRLLTSGARINEINTVRKHLSGFKGGLLAEKAYPATVLNLVLSDVVGDSLEAIASGPTVADSTTFADARKVLQRYGLWETTSSAIQQLISDGEKGVVPETPKPGDACFDKVCSVVLGNSRSAALAAVEALKSKGFNTLLLTSTLEGEAKTVGTVLASIAAEIASSSDSVARPAAVVVSGETIVTVRGKGAGGRNQELVLSAALRLQDVEGAVIASLSTDGLDGPTDAAGALVDEHTVKRARRLGLNPEKFLAKNDSYRFFSKLGDLIVTGPTRTNVNDISLIVIL